MENPEITIPDILREQLKSAFKNHDTENKIAVKCKGCGALVSLEPKMEQSKCPYCISDISRSDSTSKEGLKPDFIVPFKITEQEANSAFSNWLRSAGEFDESRPPSIKDAANGIEIAMMPKEVLKFAVETGSLKSVYLPFIHFNIDAKVNNNGIEEDKRYANILVPLSDYIDSKTFDGINDWNLNSLSDYKQSYLDGHLVERNQLSVEGTFNKAYKNIQEQINSENLKSLETKIVEIEIVSTDWKYILLPIYSNTFLFKGKHYHFYTNGSSGKTYGERSVSKTKAIILKIIFIIFALWAIYFFLFS